MNVHSTCLPILQHDAGARLLASSTDLLSRLRPQANATFTSFLVLLALLALAAAVALVIARCMARLEQHRRRSPRRLFKELCQAHQLSWSQRQLLERIAAEQQLTTPCQLFLDRAALEKLSPALQPYQAQAVELRRRLFS